jgi:hemolysin III
MISRFREPVNGLTHLLAAIPAFLGWIALIILGWGDSLQLIGACIFGLSLTVLFIASGLYHSVIASAEVIQRLRKFDHAAIYLLIAGTYTPICLQFLDGAWRWGLLLVVWTLAIAGIVIKLRFIDAPRWLNTAPYLVLGWMAILAVPELLSSMPLIVVIWMAVGGGLYTLGAISYLLGWPVLKPGVFGNHELWHIFVILAGASHFAGIAISIAGPPGLA